MKRDYLYELLLNADLTENIYESISNKDIISFLSLLLKFQKSNVNFIEIIANAIQQAYLDGKLTEDQFKSIVFGLKNDTSYKFTDLFRYIDKGLYNAKHKPNITLSKEEYNKDKFNNCYMEGALLSAYYAENENEFLNDINNFIGKTYSVVKDTFIYETVTTLNMNNILEYNKVYIISKKDFNKIKEKTKNELLNKCLHQITEDGYKFMSALKLNLPNNVEYYDIDSVTGIPRIQHLNSIAMVLGKKGIVEDISILLRRDIEVDNPNELTIVVRSDNNIQNHIDTIIPLYANDSVNRNIVISFHYLLKQYKLIETNVWIGKESKNRKD